MIGLILVPLDGSSLAEEALAYAVPIAERCESKLELVRVVDPDAKARDVEEALAYLNALRDRIGVEARVDARRGDPSEEIIAMAGESPAAMIVMSTHGRGGIRKWISGSVADRVMRLSGAPVLMVRSGQEIPRRVDLKRIVVPVDGSETAEEAIRWAAALATGFDSELHIVRVVDTPSLYQLAGSSTGGSIPASVFDEIVSSMTKEANDYVMRIVAELQESGTSARPVVLDGYAGEALLSYERQGAFQLVVMTTNARAGVSRVVFGSVAERILKLGRSPVLMIRAPISTENEHPASVHDSASDHKSRKNEH